ncbi:nucleoside triphosphate pyrophosphohydrolase [Paenibacillus lutrae]|uniref:Phosphoribosyl-ATP pyrophosphohydrolase n=1 Tax=Paenibacillus lutrae TaxID=2078573 RepID=A0A7X3K0G7_9BACL|nr:phosphoribosyl-ATP pyrophosphohydrolase [Paenibacillus lutrae]
MAVYNKLVRDRIPDIIRENGQACRTRILTEPEYKQELHKKLHEELREYLDASVQDDRHAVEELADLLEVIQALAGVHHCSVQELEAVREEKAAERGGFKAKVYLMETTG